MGHFLEISQLTCQQIQSLLERANHFKRQTEYPKYSSEVVAPLFYENSTRTRVSFELAAKHLSMKVVHLDLQNSSETKGEVIEDTISTLAAMGIRYFVIRHQSNDLPQQLAAHFINEGIHIINAGNGTHAHPTQALLDMMTILEKKPNLSDLKIAIVGNIKHSRVANSFQCISKSLGVGELILIAPEIWHPETVHYGSVTTEIKEGLQDADVVMCLRVQKERLLASEHFNIDKYRNQFAITSRTLAFAKKDALVMHPGPINRGIEIDSDIIDGLQSCVLTQIKNGVFARMAVLDSLAKP